MDIKDSIVDALLKRKNEASVKSRTTWREAFMNGNNKKQPWTIYTAQ